MNRDFLYKKDAVIILEELMNGDDLYPIQITSKEGGNYYGKWLEFEPELSELEISDTGDDCWVCETDKMVLKEELEKRGFIVKLGY